MSDIFSNALNGLSDAIHSAGKSSIGQMAEAAALTYFLGPAGAEFSIPTAAGLAGGITNLLNGGNIGSALTAGAMGYGLGSLSGVGEANPNAANVPVEERIPTPVDQIAPTGVNVPASVANFEAPPAPFTGTELPSDLKTLEPGSAYPQPGPSAPPPGPSTPGQMAVADNAQYANTANPLTAAPAPSGNILSRMYDYLTTPGTPDAAGTAPGTVAGKTSFYQDIKSGLAGLSPLEKAGLGLGAVSLLKSAAKPQTLNYKAPNNQQIRYFGGNQFSGPSNMYQTSTGATGGLVALAQGGGVRHYDDGGNVNSDYTPQQIADYISQNNLSGDSLAAAEQQFGVTPDQVSYAQAQAAPAAPDTSTAPAVPDTYTGIGGDGGLKMPDYYVAPASNTSQPDYVQAPDYTPATPQYTSYTDQQIKDYFAQNPGANVALAEQQFNADPNQVNTVLGAVPSTAAVLQQNAQPNNLVDSSTAPGTGAGASDGSYIAGNGHLMVPDGGQDDNGQPTYTDRGVPQGGASVNTESGIQPIGPTVQTLANPTSTGIASLPAASNAASTLPSTTTAKAIDPTSVNGNSSATQIADAIGMLQRMNLSDNQIAQQLYNQGVLAPQVLSAEKAAPGDAAYNRIENAYGQTTLTNPSVYGIDPNAPVSPGLAAIDKAITQSSTATPQQAGIQAIQNAKEYGLLQSIANPSATDITNFNNGSAADKNKAIQNAVTAATDLYGGNTTQAQAAIAALMDKWGVKPADVGTAIGVKPDVIQGLYNAVDPGGIYALKAAINNTTTPATPVISPASTGGGGASTSKSTATTAPALTNPTTLTPTTLSAPTTPVTTPLTTPTSTFSPTTVMANTLTQPANNYTPGYISNSTTNPTSASGVSGSHAFIDANGYVSQRANQVGQPLNAQGFLGNWTSLQQMKDAYTKAGGSLGATNPAAPATTTDAATQHILDMLSGKIPASKVPYTPTGEIFKPYYTSVMGMAENPVYTISQPTIFDPTSKKYVTNPNYDPNFNATADYIGAYDPGYTGKAVPGLSQKTLDYLNQNGVSSYGTSTTAAASLPSTNASGQLVVKGQTYPTGSYIAGNGHLMVPDGGQDGNGQPTYTDLGVQAAGGGLMGLAAGGMSVGHLGGYSDGGRLLRGPGDGVSDSIPATIGSTNPEPARLADGEFVVPARIVSELGNGSTEAGARQLYKMMDRIQNTRRKTVGKNAVATNTNAHQYLPA